MKTLKAFLRFQEKLKSQAGLRQFVFGFCGAITLTREGFSIAGTAWQPDTMHHCVCILKFEDWNCEFG